jgi:hypothetical protein
VNAFRQSAQCVRFVELRKHGYSVVGVLLELALDFRQQSFPGQGTLPKGAQCSQEFGHALVLIHPSGAVAYATIANNAAAASGVRIYDNPM